MSSPFLYLPRQIPFRIPHIALNIFLDAQSFLILPLLLISPEDSITSPSIHEHPLSQDVDQLLNILLLELLESFLAFFQEEIEDLIGVA